MESQVWYKSVKRAKKPGKIRLFRHKTDFIVILIMVRSYIPADELDESGQSQLSACEQVLGYVFEDKRLLEEALTHSSGAVTRSLSNERLEFLGDSALGLVICDHLFREYPEFQEGDMTKIKSIVVSRQTCALVSESQGIGKFLHLGRGMARNVGMPSSLLANLQEAIIGAIYLDSDFETAREYVERNFLPHVEEAIEGREGENFKAALQNLIQKEHGKPPVYALLDVQGPEHSKCFKVAVKAGGYYYPSAWGKSKKEAEQHAAENAMCILNNQAPIHPSDD